MIWIYIILIISIGLNILLGFLVKKNKIFEYERDQDMLEALNRIEDIVILLKNKYHK